MTIQFSKYQGTGNDFVIIDNRESIFPKNNTPLIARLCDRKFGIGADGLILLEKHSELDFRMVYYNSDGNESSMCGNGGRCVVAFAKALNMINSQTTFEAIDGYHEASIDGEMVRLKMQDVQDIRANSDFVFMDTGSPHHVILRDQIQEIDVRTEGAAIRYSDLYGQEGSNVNFVEQKGQNIFAVRTYERGVENETLSCGTGVTAVALAMDTWGHSNSNEIKLLVEGGELQVVFEKREKAYANIFLIGPAQFVFKGEFTC